MKRTAALSFGLLAANQIALADIGIAQAPLFVSDSAPPLNMLVMGRDHKLFYEAYNDASDLNGDGVIDVGYKGYLSAADGGIDYYGYFNSNVCYIYTGGVFTPSSAASNKKCSGKWSGDFLNYLATSRMDALRKVLYGGYRVTDTAGTESTPAKTVLQAAFIPQDAHTWGKEYSSQRKDGYLISDYAPLSQPVSGYRHLFAVVSLTDGGIPQLRTLTNTTFRIWNWVSKEIPVAGDSCGNNEACTSRGPTSGWSIVPAEVFSGLTVTTWEDEKDAPTSMSAMNKRFSTPSNRCGSGNATFTNLNANTEFVNPYTSAPENCTQDSFITLVEGTFTPPETSVYAFSVDGDDAVDFMLGSSVIASRYGKNPTARKGGTGKINTGINLVGGQTYSFKLRHKERGGKSNFGLYWKAPSTGTSKLTNANIKVAVCPADAKLQEDNCAAYTNGSKPTGILHNYGNTDKMLFGLLSGSFQNNMSGGVLRRPLGSFKKEFNPSTGQFCSSSNSSCDSDSITNGIVYTINKFRIIDFNYGKHSYGCGWIAGRAMVQGDKCYMWGNPIAEMMYETMRYFSGAKTPTSLYKYSNSAVDNKSPLNLPVVNTWLPPYKTATATNGGYERCAVPVMTVISDINPSYDGDVPGSAWGATVNGSGNPASIRNLNVSTEADKVWTKEGGGSKNVFIGASKISNEDGAPTEKTVSKLSTVRGLAPEEPSKQGTYYSAAIANFGANNPIGGDKNLQTYAVALASPLPTIKFPVAKNGKSVQTVTVVPFAKSVGGGYSISATSNFQPTDQIVDYYVETIVNTDPACPSAGSDCDPSVNGGRPYAKFRINYEDVEQGADHDMDAIVLYELMLNSAGKLVINLTSEYAAGTIDQHMGYVISGTETDGIYLEVKDQSGHNVAYKLDTPSGKNAGDCANPKAKCPALSALSSSRTFTPGGSSATFLEGPLWYAAKYGIDSSPDDDEDGIPDNYFLVTNALTLKAQLAKAFNDITQKNSSVSNPTVEAPRDSTTTDDAFIYRTDFSVNGWAGDLIKEQQTTKGGELVTEPVWKASSKIPATRHIYMAGDNGNSKLIDFNWNNLANKSFDNIDFQTALNTDGLAMNAAVDNFGQARVKYIRGESCTTGTGCGTFRTRDSALGDIVNSSPVLVKGAQYLAYRAGALDGGAASYSAFQTKVALRKPMIYVGANDGMLHAFNADTGAEVFAFIPTAAIPNLSKLTSPQYGGVEGVHQYFVDGTPTIADVYYGNTWHTVLVGTMGAGGREVFALDITDPGSPKLLWEFTSESHNNMGYSLPKPIITRLNSGKWAAVFANGYNSKNNNKGRATLFIKDIETGDEIKSLTVQGLNGTNGLSSPRTADINADGITDYVYAGDLQGNMWRFDLFNANSSTPFAKCTRNCSGLSAKYRVSFEGHPLYVAKDGATGKAKRQPITSAPTLARHPTSAGYLVTFGTGSYLNSNDKASLDKQSVYGIWDRNTTGQNVSSTPTLDRSNLQQQTMTETSVPTSDTTKTVRLLSDNSISWYNAGATETTNADVAKWGWFLDLNAGAAKGERVVSNMMIYGDGLIFSTITPSADPCTAGLEGFTYGINPTTGQRTLYDVFDMNGDGEVNAQDSLNGDVVSGHETPAGGFNIKDGLQYHTDGSSTAIAAGSSSIGRLLWRVQPANTSEAAR